MASSVEISYLGANAQAIAAGGLANGGLLNLYSGPQPATPETAINTASNTLLLQASFGNPAFGSATNGIVTTGTLGVVAIQNSGTANFFRAVSTSGSALFDGSVGVSTGTNTYDWNVNSVALTAGASFLVTNVNLVALGT